MSTWRICLTEIQEEKHLKLSLNQIYDPLATLSAPQHFGFFRTQAAKAPHLQELVGCLRPRLSPDAQNRAFANNGSYTQIVDTTLITYKTNFDWPDVNNKLRIKAQEQMYVHNIITSVY